MDCENFQFFKKKKFIFQVSAQFAIIEFPADFSDFLSRMVIFNFVGTYSADRALRFLFGFGSLKEIL